MNITKYKTAIGAAVLCLILTFAGFGQTANSTQILQPLQTLEREMNAAETHRYKIELKANEFFQVRVEQKDIDVVLELSDSSGGSLAKMDSPNLNRGFEILSWVADKPGVYEIKISPFENQSQSKRYGLRRAESRTATENDLKRIQNERLFVQAMSLQSARGIGAGQNSSIIRQSFAGLEGSARRLFN